MRIDDFLADYESRLSLREQDARIARRAEWTMVVLAGVFALVVLVYRSMVA